jgi:carbonic anhydrase
MPTRLALLLAATAVASGALANPVTPAAKPVEPVGVAASSAAPAAAPAASAAGADARTERSGRRASRAAEEDPMEILRRRLADRLGAAPAPDQSGTLRVTSRSSAANGESMTAAQAKPAEAGTGTKGAPTPLGKQGATQNGAPTSWGYEGANGPEAWGRLRPEFSLCAKGQRQSPIDLRDGFRVDLEPVRFDYRPSGFSVIDNGHTVQANVASGNTIEVLGRRYELKEFHFHRPSEERIDGKAFDMSAHLVHRSADGHAAIVAVLLQQGSAQPVVQTVWNSLPLEKGLDQPASSTIDLGQFLPEDRRYYVYMGSLTTPPCSEGVLWIVMKQPVGVAADQVELFSRLYPMNARPLQPSVGRMVKESR